MRVVRVLDKTSNVKMHFVAFTWLSNLTPSPPNPQIPYSCDVCDKTFIHALAPWTSAIRIGYSLSGTISIAPLRWRHSYTVGDRQKRCGGGVKIHDDILVFIFVGRILCVVLFLSVVVAVGVDNA